MGGEGKPEIGTSAIAELDLVGSENTLVWWVFGLYGFCVRKKWLFIVSQYLKNTLLKYR